MNSSEAKGWVGVVGVEGQVIIPGVFENRRGRKVLEEKKRREKRANAVINILINSTGGRGWQREEGKEKSNIWELNGRKEIAQEAEVDDNNNNNNRKG